MVQGLAFLSKKSWHTKNLSNQEKVWIAEEKLKVEKAKTSELARQIQLEREQDELNELAGKKRAVIDRGIDWMYQGSAKDSEIAKEDAEKKAEEYLLGKAYVPENESKIIGDLEVEGNEGVNAVVVAAASHKYSQEVNGSDFQRGQTMPAESSVLQRNEAFRLRLEDPMYSVSVKAVLKKQEIEKKQNLYKKALGVDLIAVAKQTSTDNNTQQKETSLSIDDSSTKRRSSDYYRNDEPKRSQRGDGEKYKNSNKYDNNEALYSSNRHSSPSSVEDSVSQWDERSHRQRHTRTDDEKAKLSHSYKYDRYSERDRDDRRKRSKSDRHSRSRDKHRRERSNSRNSDDSSNCYYDDDRRYRRRKRSNSHECSPDSNDSRRHSKRSRAKKRSWSPDQNRKKLSHVAKDNDKNERHERDEHSRRNYKLSPKSFEKSRRHRSHRANFDSAWHREEDDLKHFQSTQGHDRDDFEKPRYPQRHYNDRKSDTFRESMQSYHDNEGRNKRPMLSESQHKFVDRSPNPSWEGSKGQKSESGNNQISRDNDHHEKQNNYDQSCARYGLQGANSSKYRNSSAISLGPDTALLEQKRKAKEDAQKMQKLNILNIRKRQQEMKMTPAEREAALREMQNNAFLRETTVTAPVKSSSISERDEREHNGPSQKSGSSGVVPTFLQKVREDVVNNGTFSERLQQQRYTNQRNSDDSFL